MREAVIVSTARTPIGKAFRGAFNDTEAPVLSGHVVREAVRRAGIDGAEVEDLVLGCATQQGTQGYNIARLTVVTAGLPPSVAGMTLDRKCAQHLCLDRTEGQETMDELIIGQNPSAAGGDGAAVIMDGDQKNFMKEVVETSRTLPGPRRLLGDLVRPVQATHADAGEGGPFRRRSREDWSRSTSTRTARWCSSSRSSACRCSRYRRLPRSGKARSPTCSRARSRNPR